MKKAKNFTKRSATPGKNGAVLVAAAGNLSLSTLGAVWSIRQPGKRSLVWGGADTDEKGEPVSSLWYLKSEAVFVKRQMEIMKGKRVPLLQSPGFQEKSQNISFKSRKPPKQKFGNG